MALDEVLTEKGSFLRRLAFYIRDKLGWTARRLTPLLYPEGDHFVIKITPSPFVISARSRVFDKLQDLTGSSVIY
jgi:hypothetical protein